MEDLFRSAVTILLFFLILGGLVLIHEIGHFVTARMANVRVLEFGVGFPPRAKVLRSKGETLYTLNWLPIGGFVKLEGEDGDEADDPRSFAAARLPIRLIILAAGVAMNLLTAFLIFFFIFWLATPLVGLKFANVDPGSPAATAGLVPGDAILAVNGEQREFFVESTVLEDLGSYTGETVTLTVKHADGTVEPVEVTLRAQDEIDAAPKDERPPDEGAARDQWHRGRVLRHLQPRHRQRDQHCRTADRLLVRPDPRRTRRPRQRVRQQPDGCAAGLGPGRDRDPDRRHLLQCRARS